MVSERRPLRFGPLAPPPTSRVTVDPALDLAVAPRITYEDAERLGRERVQEGVLRPADNHKADLEGAQLAWIPLWRVDASVEGFHLGLRTIRRGEAKTPVVLPTGGAQQRDEVLVLSARRILAYDIAPRVTLDPADLVSRASLGDVEGEWLDVDVPRDEAEHDAGARLRGRVTPSRALVSRYEVRVRAAVLVRYPVWIRRYQYAGEAAQGQPFEGHVALSARDGAVLSERHPAAWRALAGRVRRLFTR